MSVDVSLVSWSFPIEKIAARTGHAATVSTRYHELKLKSNTYYVKRVSETRTYCNRFSPPRTEV